MLKFASIVLVVCVLTGCGSIREKTMPAEDNLLSGAGSIVHSKQKIANFEQIDIDVLLKEYGLDDMKSIADGLDKPRYLYLRNDMQDRIIAASDQRCGYYLRQLVASKSQTKMTWGGLALLLSGAASVTRPIASAQILAAGSSFATGVNTLFDEAYFNNLTVNVIAGGISKQREGLRVQMTELRKKPLPDYPVNRAVADAIVYHSSCNIVTGLEAAANAIQVAPAATKPALVPTDAPVVTPALAVNAALVPGTPVVQPVPIIAAAPNIPAAPVVPGAPIAPPAVTVPASKTAPVAPELKIQGVAPQLQ